MDMFLAGMFNAIRQGWRRLRSNYWAALVFDAAALLAVFFLIHAWQTRDLLPVNTGQPAPGFELAVLDGGYAGLGEPVSDRTVMYFFAPWCQVCNLTAGHLEKLHRNAAAGELRVLAMAMDYQSVDSVRAFAERHGLSMPVLLGDTPIREKYRIRGYPTYYLLDEQHRIIRRSTGYGTSLGLRWFAR